LWDLQADICESIYAAFFFIPALITEDIGYGSSVFSARVMDEQASEAEYWRGEVELEQLQADNIHYLPAEVGDVEVLRDRVESMYGLGNPTAALIVRWVEHGLKSY
jgi:hypothetical protein